MVLHTYNHCTEGGETRESLGFSERPYLRKLRGGMMKRKHELSATGLDVCTHTHIQTHTQTHTHGGWEKMLKTVFSRGVLASNEAQERPSL